MLTSCLAWPGLAWLLVTFTAAAKYGAKKIEGPARGKPNIVFIIADDLGYNDIGYNNPEIRTPNLDKLAKEGIILESNYVQPSCTPSRSALMTGIYPYKYGRQGNPLSHNTPTGLSLNLTIMPQFLRKLNYNTHHVGKWHLGFCKEAYLPSRRGFQSTYGSWSGYTDYFTKETRMYYFNSSGYMFYDNDIVDLSARGLNIDKLLGARADLIIRNHAAKAAKTTAPQPLFLYLAPQSPHFPDSLKEFTRPQVISALSVLDQVVGMVTTALKETGLYDNTIIVFTSDNGGDNNFGGNNLPLRGQKETLWEGAVRVPGFVHSPLLPTRGVIIRRLFHITDWLPTLARAAGMPPAEIERQGWDGIDQWDGLSFPHKKNGGPRRRTQVVHNLNVNSYGRFQGAMRDGPYKLMVDMARKSSDWIAPIPVDSLDYAYTLYNVEQDPTEKTNIAANNSAVLIKMVAKVEELRKGMVLPNDEPVMNAGIKNGIWVTNWC